MYNRKDCKKNQRQIIKLLREITSHTHYGKKFVDGVRHCVRNETIQRHYNLRESHQKTFLKRILSRELKEHFAGNETFYFTGNQRMTGECKFSLVMIDIDCHGGVGSHTGAVLFAQWIKENFFPNLYHEPSTNGIGVHCYILIRKNGTGAKLVNDAIDHLQKALQPHASKFDVQLVEVKGKCPEITWDKKNICTAVKGGTLAKIPRGDFTTTDRVDILDIMRLSIQKQETILYRNQNCGYTAKGKISGSDGAKYFDDKEIANLIHIMPKWQPC